MLALLALAATALSACTPTPEPTPTPSAAFASEEEAFAAAEEVYRAYMDAFNQVDLRDPSTFEPVFQYSTGDYLSSEKESLSQLHAEGHLRDGAIKIVTFEGTVYDGGDHVEAITCNDVSATTFTDEDGTNLVPKDRPDRYALLLTLVVADSALRIESATPTEDPGCASS